jgi:hypothetical protein
MALHTRNFVGLKRGRHNSIAKAGPKHPEERDDRFRTSQKFFLRVHMRQQYQIVPSREESAELEYHRLDRALNPSA